MKREFILDEIWMLTINAAFQRASIYKSNATESAKFAFKKELKGKVNTISKSYITGEVEEKEHIKNIQSIIAFSEQFKGILNNGKLNFGISQKILNLYLKYLWCLDVLKFPPPHFPVDRIIQGKLKINTPFPWTQMSNEKEYGIVIERAKKILMTKEFENLKNLPELELFLFNRRSN